MRSVGNMTVATIAFIPLESDDVTADVDRVLALIDRADVEYSVGSLSTEIRGEKQTVLSLIENIYDTMDALTGFTMDVKLSNVCGE